MDPVNGFTLGATSGVCAVGAHTDVLVHTLHPAPVAGTSEGIPCRVNVQDSAQESHW